MRHFLLLLLLLLTTRVFAQFSGQGSGTGEDPYQVSNADELFEVRNDLSAYYIQTADIDLTQWILENNPVQGWNPIGNDASPFSGYYNGNNYSIIGLSINRESSNNVGMWGVIKNATIANLALINPSVVGCDNVGILVGKIAMPYGNSISCVSVINGNVTGSSLIGGIVGSALLEYEGNWGDYNDPQWNITWSNNTIHGCFCNANIYGENECGGICGAINGEYNQTPYLNDHIFKIEVLNNIFSGKIIGKNLIGGILGCIRPTEGVHYSPSGTISYNGNYALCHHNIAMGKLFGEQEVRGIVGQYNEDLLGWPDDGIENLAMVNYNVSCLDTIKGSEISRVSNAPFSNNISWSKTIGIRNNKPYTFTDSDYNGIGYGINTLKKRTTYEGLGFDFTKVWTISENLTFPYSIHQAEMPIVNVFNSGSKGKMEGTCNGNGNIFVIVNNVLYCTYSVEGKWEISLGSISDGQSASVSFSKSGLQPSVPTLVTASKAENVLGEIGDANGDGTIDAVDVVSIINYILGKPSLSFNDKNADINSDGQILVDDAVGTVNLIMSNQ